MSDKLTPESDPFFYDYDYPEGSCMDSCDCSEPCDEAYDDLIQEELNDAKGG